MEARSIRKLETRHVNLKPTERSEGGFKFTCRVSNFRIDRYRHSLTDLYTGITNSACVHGSTNGTNCIPISFKVLPMVPLVIPLVPMVPLVKTDGSQYFRQSTVWAKLQTLESHMIQYGVLNFKFINFTNKHYFYQGDIRK